MTLHYEIQQREMISIIFSKYHQDTFVSRERIAVSNQIIDRRVGLKYYLYQEAEALYPCKSA